jgi:hypothetical protein
MIKESSNLKRHVKILALPASSSSHGERSSSANSQMETVKLLGSLSSLVCRCGKKENEVYLYPQVASSNKNAVFSSFVAFTLLL